MSAARAERRARRLVRWYPRSFRARYGDELCALLEDELASERSAARTTLNVAANGVVARAGAVGLCGPLDPRTQGAWSLAWVAVSTCAFAAFAASMWSQLVVGWQWTPPDTLGTTWATVAMSVASYALLALGAAALVPVLAVAAARARRSRAARLRVPLAVLAAASVVLVSGARRFENGWPGTGGHPWALRGIVPGGLAAFTWSATLGISSYWLHPSALHRFPAGEVAWMAVGPIVLVALGVAGAVVLRRVELPARVLHFELRCAQTATVAMAAYVVAAVLWLADGERRPAFIPANLFHPGAIDVAGLAVMVVALVCAHVALHRGLAALRDGGVSPSGS